MVNVQIFGLKNSHSVRAAERFFKERRIAVHFVDLNEKPMSPGEINRFIDRFGLMTLVDTSGKAWVEAGLQYLKLTDEELLTRVRQEPRLLKLPLVRSGRQLSIGQHEAAWKEMVTQT